MVHKDVIERRKEKSKPRGKPFEKGNQLRAKVKGKAVDDSGHQIGVEGGVVAPAPQCSIVEPANANDGIEFQLPSIAMDTLKPILKEAMNPTPTEEKEEKENDVELIEAIDFMNGPNKLSLRFSKKKNRVYRIQVFLNDVEEIRPVTYSGATTGVSFWRLLKGTLKNG